MKYVPLSPRPVLRVQRTDTRSVCESLTRWFTEYGWPTYIRTDGGPQFRGEFAEFCEGNSVKHEQASAYNPESNGLAEAAVKNMIRKRRKENAAPESSQAECVQYPQRKQNLPCVVHNTLQIVPQYQIAISTPAP